MSYGITTEGFNTKTFDVLRQELFDLWRISFGTIDTDPDGAFGQIGNSASLSNAEMWELLQQAWMQGDYRNATGGYLDKLMSYVNLSRKAPTKSGSICYFGGADGTFIPIGTKVTQLNTNKMFSATNSIYITSTKATRFLFALNRGSIDTVVGFRLNSITVAIPYVSTDSDEMIFNKIITILMQNSPQFGISDAYIDNGKLAVECYNPFEGFSITLPTKGTISTVWSYCYVQADIAGVNPIPANSLKMYTSVDGLTDVRNPVSGNSGTDAETDSEFRRRRERGVQIGSSATEGAIESKLWDSIKEVSTVRVSSNRSDVTDVWGRPPHSVQVVVEGGTDLEVANLLFDCLPVGVGTFGTTSVSVTRPYMINPTTIKFSRVGTLFGWIKIIINSYNSEESFPSNGKDLIREAVYAEALRSAGLGVDIVAQKFIGAIYRAVSGLSDITVLCGVTGTVTTGNTNPPNVQVGTPENYNPLTYSSGWMNIVPVSAKDRVEFRDAFNANRIIIE